MKLNGTQDLNAPPVGNGWGDPTVVGTPAQLCLASAPTYSNCNPGAEAGPYAQNFPYLAYIDYLANMYKSHFNALQVILTQRTSHGLSFTANYTYSHALDDVSQNFGSTIPLDNANPALMYANSDYDIRHRFTLQLAYALPGLKSPGQALEGWQVSSIVTIQSATPWSVQDLSNDFSGTGEVNNPNPWGEAWDFFGNPSDFTASPNGIPYFTSAMSICGICLS